MIPNSFKSVKTEETGQAYRFKRDKTKQPYHPCDQAGMYYKSYAAWYDYQFMAEENGYIRPLVETKLFAKAFADNPLMLKMLDNSLIREADNFKYYLGGINGKSACSLDFAYYLKKDMAKREYMGRDPQSGRDIHTTPFVTTPRGERREYEIVAILSACSNSPYPYSSMMICVKVGGEYGEYGFVEFNCGEGGESACFDESGRIEKRNPKNVPHVGYKCRKFEILERGGKFYIKVSEGLYGRTALYNYED